jgi:hypothetical protein
MKADVSRWTFDPLKGYARVLQQQGRPHLDADWNEQVAILLHRLHVLGRDLIGPYGGPSDACGFEISGFAGGPHDFEIGAGRYYVNGVCCENPGKILFSTQPIKVHHGGIETGKYYLVFLDAWEDVVSFADDLNLIEPALGGIDTSMRTRIAWQVRTQEIDPAQDDKYVFDNWHNLVAKWQPPHRGELRARIAPASEERVSEQTFAGSTQRYRGLENQLYRVEIHHGGAGTGTAMDGATFKWSRENGSVMFRLLKMNENVLTLERLDATGAAVLTPGDWLEEVVTGGSHPTTPRGPLIRVLHRGPGRDDVTVHWGSAKIRPDPAQRNGLWLRRWDQRARQANRGGTRLREEDGSVIITEGEGLAGWIALEHGIEVQFAPGGTYRPGDYWIIPARIADDGTLLWPVDSDGPRSMGPHGADHAYAPLAIVEFKPTAERKQSCRRQFRPLATIAR